MPARATRPEDATLTPVDVLAEASEQLRGSLHAVSAQGMPLGAEALDGLETVVETVASALQDDVAPDALLPSGNSTLDARLLMALRASVLRLDLPLEASPAVLSVLRVLEALLSRVLGVDHESLASRLTQPDALQLLVEVAHDLRAPLTSILFLSETLRIGHSGGVNEQQRGQLGLIYSAALNLASLTSNVVDLARDGRGLIDGEPELYSIAEMARGVQEMVQPMADEKRVELRFVVDEYDRAYGYPVALGRVLLNLTTNALKFTDEGYVEVGANRRSSSRVEFYVRDTGRGIGSQRQEELFSPFKKRAYSDGHFFSGSGVGLSIARRIVRAMGAELEFETAEGWGTRFHFTVDVAPPR